MSGTQILPTRTFQLSPDHQFLSSSPKSINFQRSASYPSRNPTKFKIQSAFTETLPRINIKKSTTNLYEILQIKETASPAEIKSAYRSLAKRIHPDVSRSNSREFIEMHNAYETLSDPMARARYDLTLNLVGIKKIGFGDSIFRGKGTRRWETDQCW